MNLKRPGNLLTNLKMKWINAECTYHTCSTALIRFVNKVLQYQIICEDQLHACK